MNDEYTDEYLAMIEECKKIKRREYNRRYREKHQEEYKASYKRYNDSRREYQKEYRKELWERKKKREEELMKTAEGKRILKLERIERSKKSRGYAYDYYWRHHERVLEYHRQRREKQKASETGVQ